MKKVDILGKTFGNLKVLDKSNKKRKDGIYFWLCQCTCGTIREVNGSSLRNGRAKWCSVNCKSLLKQKNLERFHKQYIIDEGGCWIWIGSKNKQGYGKFANNFAHRFSFKEFVQPIEKGMQVCHQCDTPSCVNPEHLWTGSARENSDDKIKKGRMKTGTSHGRAKLDIKDIYVINYMFSKLKMMPSQIAKHFNVTKETIYNLINKKTYKEVFMES